MRSSFLDYAMSVIVSRALPDARDGLKPVHRRVLYAMNELGLQPGRPRIKCARVVGDTMGKYHPHGNQAIYDALVRMAQTFSLRYPLVDPQGNFGNVDGYPAAAERYTECRLSAMAMELLRDIDQDTIDYEPNYDGTAQAAVGPTGALPEPPRQRLVRDRGRDGDEHAAPQPRRGRRRDRHADRRPDRRRRPSQPASEGPRLPDRRDHPRPRGDPRGVPLRPRPDRDARPRAHRGAPGRQVRGRRHRAPVRREEGRRRRRDREDRRPRPRRRADGDPEHRLGRQGPLRQVRDADPDRAQARRDPAGRPQQALQAHGAPDDVRLQRRRPRRRRPADAVAPRADPPLPRPPARGRHAAAQVRAAKRGAPRARARGLPDRARQHRRGDRDDPRLGLDRRGSHRP